MGKPATDLQSLSHEVNYWREPASHEAGRDKIFRAGSKTYYFSSWFFPPEVRTEVAQLYAFVRVADNFVDCVPQNREAFEEFVAAYRGALDGTPASSSVINDFVRLSERRRFVPSWVEAFLEAMRADLTISSYPTIEDTCHYMYGSAEVVGLMMARILRLPEESLLSARMLGRAMQYINFIRDIAEDNTLGRIYLPKSEMESAGLSDLSEECARHNPQEFIRFLRVEIRRYLTWQEEAEKGFSFIPKRYRIPIATASDMYKWTALTIHRDPFIVFRKKVKPSVSRILLRGGLNSLPTFDVPFSGVPRWRNLDL